LGVALVESGGTPRGELAQLRELLGRYRPGFAVPGATNASDRLSARERPSTWQLDLVAHDRLLSRRVIQEKKNSAKEERQDKKS